jgi:hypothetical protein
MKTYYFGEMEFGDFMKGDDYYPIVLIHRVDEVREFETEEEADDYMVEHKFGGYCEATPNKLEIYFKK